MSRLQAPGFSKIKPSGLPRSSMLAAATPVVSSTEICKRPVMIDAPTVVESKRSLICKPITSSVTQHGPTPYDRTSKPATSQIPNIGKRRSMGALKTAEQRVLKEPFNPISDKENINVPKQVVKRQLDNVYKQISSQEIALQSCVVQPSSVVSKPPLVNNNLKKVMTTGQLKQPSTTNMIPILQNPLNQCPTVTTMSGSSHPNKLPSKIHSKSLQTLPGMIDKPHNTEFDAANKCLSQNDLTSSSMPIQCSSKSIPSNLTKKTRIKSKLGLKGQLGGLRPRISTHISGTETMSTPYNTVQSKHLEYLKISPIISEVDVTDADSTFSVFQEPSSHASKLLNVSCNKFLNLKNKDQCDEIIAGQKTQVLENFDNHFQNATYNHEYENDQDEECQQKVLFNKTVNITRNRNEEFDQYNVPAFNTTQILCKDIIASDPNETFGFLDKTQVISGKVEANCNKTQILIDDENELFIENEKMPKNFIEDTPGKLNHGLNEFESQNESFSDDIQKVLAAISCKNKNDCNPTVTVSPLKNFTPNKAFSNSSSIDTENANNSSIDTGNANNSSIDIEKTNNSSIDTENVNNSPSDTVNNSSINTENTSNVDATNGSSAGFKGHLPSMSFAATNTFSNADFKITEVNENETVFPDIKNEKSEIYNQTDHFDSQKLKNEGPPETMPLPDTSEDEDECHDNSVKTPVKKNIHNMFDVESLFPLSAQLPPPSSVGNEEFTYGIENRCYTISMGDIGRKREASNFRLKRSQTYGARDFAYNFRPPRQMQMAETVEGNIVMDNASFLHFTNEIKFLKTQLLKLKRTLLEADYFSPLIKGPLKLSNYLEGSSVPPLSPRLFLSSPMAVVDPLVVTDNTVFRENVKERQQSLDSEDDLSTLTQRFQDSLRRLEELEKEAECKNNTIKLLQIQLENYESKEQDILEENIFLREEVSHLNERLCKMQETNGKEMNLSASFEDFNIIHLQSRKTMLNRLYSNGSSD